MKRNDQLEKAFKILIEKRVDLAELLHLLDLYLPQQAVVFYNTDKCMEDNLLMEDIELISSMISYINTKEENL